MDIQNLRSEVLSSLNRKLALPPKLLTRYCDLIIKRAVRSYLVERFDISTIEEDLYTEDNGKTYPNLDHMENIYSKDIFGLEK